MSGVLASQQLRTAVEQGWVRCEGSGPARHGIDPGQYQPASLDLRLGSVAYRVRASFVPGDSLVQEKLQDLTLYEVPLQHGAILERGAIYVVPLVEDLALPPSISGRTNPKSSTGRLDIFTRVITDRSSRFDDIHAGYHGRLYVEIMSRSFTIRVNEGLTLTQLRLQYGDHSYSALELACFVTQCPFFYDHSGHALPPFLSPCGRTVSLSFNGASAIAGYKVRHTTEVVDLSQRYHYDPALFWEPITQQFRCHTPLILEPETFYLLMSRECIALPLVVAAEILPYDPGAGELRTHYAGFIDPGFGCHGHTRPQGTPVVLEVRPHDVPFLLEDGQPLASMTLTYMDLVPECGYGVEIHSNYTDQQTPFSKHFGPWAQESE